MFAQLTKFTKYLTAIKIVCQQRMHFVNFFVNNRKNNKKWEEDLDERMLCLRVLVGVKEMEKFGQQEVCCHKR